MLNSLIIGARISNARKARGLSQTQLAAELNVSPQAVGKWERGESMPDIITFDRMTNVLAVDLNYFSENCASGGSLGDGNLNDGGLGGGSQSGSPYDDGESSDVAFQAMTADSPAGSQNGLNSASTDATDSTGRHHGFNGGRHHGFNMSGWSWKDADFSGLTGIGGKFNGANIQRCTFVGTDLSGIKLKGNTVIGNDFSGCDFSDSLISGSTLSKCRFNDSSLANAKLSGSLVSDCDFSNADFSEAVLKGSSLVRNNLNGVRWQNTAFLSMRFMDTVFSGEINSCSFESCSFGKTSFQNVSFSNTFFKNRSLKKVEFLNCRADSITLAFLKSSGVDVSAISLII